MELLRSHQPSYTTDWKSTSSPVHGRWHGAAAFVCAMGLVLILALLGWLGPSSTLGSLSRLSMYVMAPKVAPFKGPDARIVKGMGGPVPSYGRQKSTAIVTNKVTYSKLKFDFHDGLGQYLATHSELHVLHPSTLVPTQRSEVWKSNLIEPHPEETSKVALAVPFKWLGVCLLSVLVSGGIWLARIFSNPKLTSDGEWALKYDYKAHSTIAMFAVKGDRELWENEIELHALASTSPAWRRLLPPAVARPLARLVGCEECGGTRRVACPNCDAQGRYEAMGGRYVPCRGCRGTGRVVCRGCFVGDGWDLDKIRRDMGYPDYYLHKSGWGQS